jgi:hypothetical protein
MRRPLEYNVHCAVKREADLHMAVGMKDAAIPPRQQTAQEAQATQSALQAE